jgi:hypothetical protein
MSRQLSIERVLAELKDRIEQHRSQAAFHAEQETFHQQEKVRHTADLQTVSERYETFRAAADAVGELVARKGPIEAFGATEIAHEMRNRYGARLCRKIDVRAVAAKLRRMAQYRLIHQLREGRAFHEALYSLTPGGRED